ncbi:MAG: TonB family protein [Myxococcales bacterium]|nr:TonB family protein [Myxococcales bacterium]MCB9692938.1 TonB family protein [Alphaproteobacteria bacterium]
MIALLALLVAGAAETTPPRLVADVRATYPPDARERGLQGIVELRLTVDATGTVTDAVVVRSPHPELDPAALAAARQLRFAPATVDGEPAGAEVGYRFVFSLGSSEEGGIARPATLHGTVEDADGLELPGATITARRADGTGEPITRTGSAAGRFDLPFLPPGVWLVEIAREGFEAGVFEVTLGPGETLESAFTLTPEDALEVVVWASRRTWREVDRGELVADAGTVTGVYELTRRDIESTPGSLEDVARATHALPGVVSDGDMLAGFHVRGGQQDEVVYLLDRVPLENPFHLAGFNSLFNPDMIDGVRFFAGAAPANVPSGTSAVMDVTTWDGAPREPGGGLDGAVDLSASSARVFLMGPLDDDERFTFALAARRTYMEGYFQVLKWANVIDNAFAAPEFSELSARAAWRPDSRTRVMVSALRSSDSLALVDSEDDSLVNFSGAFELKNGLTLLSADHRYVTPDGLSWQTTVARTWDRSFQRRDLAGTVERTTRLSRSFVRTDGVVPITEHSRVKVGGDASRFQLAASGDLEDNRLLPTWTQAGIADFGFELARVDNAPDPWTEANLYAEAEIEAPLGQPVTRRGRTLQPAIKLRAGTRVQYAGLTGEILPSPRAGIAVPLPTGTIPKVSLGHYQQVMRDPIKLADGYGSPDLRASRARHLVVGVDQAIPLPGEGTGGLLRVEAYRIALTDLVVTPDTPERLATAAYTNDGTGLNRGVDVMAAARMGRFNGQLAYGLLFATRDNPTNRVWPTEVAPQQDQRHTLSIAGDYQLFAHWRMTARYAFHSGRPVSRVDVDDPLAETVRLTCLNCDRLGPTHQLDLRAEWRRAYERYRMTFYVEVLNVGNIQSDFLPIHDVIDGSLSTSMLRHLPMRPFLGLRADF